MAYHTLYNGMVSLLCVISYVKMTQFSKCLVTLCMSFLLCVSFHVYIVYIYETSFLYDISYVLLQTACFSKCPVTLCTCVWILSSVYHYMSTFSTSQFNSVNIWSLSVHMYVFSPVCILLCSLICLHVQMTCHTHHICNASLLYVFS